MTRQLSSDCEYACVCVSASVLARTPIYTIYANVGNGFVRIASCRPLLLPVVAATRRDMPTYLRQLILKHRYAYQQPHNSHGRLFWLSELANLLRTLAIGMSWPWP